MQTRYISGRQLELNHISRQGKEMSECEPMMANGSETGLTTKVQMRMDVDLGNVTSPYN